MIVVTGASGQLGRQIVEDLLLYRPASQVAVSVRDPDKCEDLAKLGVRVRHGDFADVNSLAQSFEGATQMLMVSSNARATGGDTLAQHKNAIDGAKAIGVERIVYTSQIAANASSAFPPAHDHAATEDFLANSGLKWTALRNGFYAASGASMLGPWGQTGKIEAPPDGKVSWTAHSDLAAAAAIILTQDERFEGPTPPLVGPEALDFADLAMIVSDIAGASVDRQTLTDDQLTANIRARGAPEQVARLALGYFIASRAGEFSSPDDTLGQILGRPLITMRDVLVQKGKN